MIIYGFNASGGFAAAIFARLSRIKAVQLIGLASYSIYLVHLSLIMLFKDYLDTWPLAARVVAFTALSTVVGILIYKLVEVPARKMYDELRERRMVRGRRSSGRRLRGGAEVREMA
ncbi:hypothetical protein IM25_02660 [Rhodococcus sp. p52]|nr:hypothetical protein IM25_02660 [Rhodococcus sp. p52]